MNQNTSFHNNQLPDVKQAPEILRVNIDTINRWTRSKAFTGPIVGLRGEKTIC